MHFRWRILLLITFCTFASFLNVLNSNINYINRGTYEKIKTEETKKYETNRKTMHVAYLKIPKTGSSTLQNILFRFSFKNRLTVYIPNSSFVVSQQEQESLLKNSVHYDMFAFHSTYNSDFFQNFPTSESTIIGLIRHPFDRFISAAYYMRDVANSKYLKNVPAENYIQNLLEHSEKYDRGYFSPTRNLMGKYFGISDPALELDEEKLKAYLHKINSEINLVLTLERFDESLVLMKRLFSWSLYDILYESLNAYQHEEVSLSTINKFKLKKTCSLDFQIYKYFDNELDKKIANAGKTFVEEVAYFKKTLKEVNAFCSGYDNNSFHVVPRSTWGEEFIVTPGDCRRMVTNDIEFIKIFRSRPDIFQ